MKKYLKFISCCLILLVLFTPQLVLADTDTLNFCGRTAPIWQFVGYGVIAIKIIIPLAIIVLGILDLAKAVVNNDEKALSKSIKSLAMRFLAGVIVFFIPLLVDVVFGMLNDITGDALNEIDACETCLLDANSSKCDAYVSAAEAKVNK